MAKDVETTQISIRIPEGLAKQIDDVIQRGRMHSNKSEFLNCAFRLTVEWVSTVILNESRYSEDGSVILWNPEGLTARVDSYAIKYHMYEGSPVRLTAVFPKGLLSFSYELTRTMGNDSCKDIQDFLRISLIRYLEYMDQMLHAKDLLSDPDLPFYVPVK